MEESAQSTSGTQGKKTKRPWFFTGFGCLILLLLISLSYWLAAYKVPQLMDIIRGLIPFWLVFAWLALSLILLSIPYFLRARISAKNSGEVHLSSPFWSDIAKGSGRILIGVPLGYFFIFPIDDWGVHLINFILCAGYLLIIWDAIMRFRFDLGDKIAIGDDHLVIDLSLGKDQLRLEKNDISAIEIKTFYGRRTGSKEYLIFKYRRMINGETVEMSHTLEPEADLNIPRDLISRYLMKKGYPVTEVKG